jgi:hypothetical protein
VTRAEAQPSGDADPEIKLFFTAHPTTDERGSLGPTIGVFRRRADADAAAMNRGAYGGNGVVRERYGIEANGRCWLLDDPEGVLLDVDIAKRRKEIADAALAKLTPEEREALGFG